MKKRFQGHVALVTGGARGIGAATVERLAAEGAAVVIADVLDEEGKALADRIRHAEGRAIFEHLDVTSEVQWKRAVDRAETLGQLRVLVNNAGVARLEDFESETVEGWNQLIAINMTGAWLGMKTSVAALRKVGGAIVNVSSIYGYSGGTGVAAAYHASKGALRTMTKNAAFKLAKENVRVNSVHPGFVDTPMIDFAKGDTADAKAMMEYITTSTPMGRMAKPEEIASAIAFLASRDASYITGTELLVDGGFTAV